MRCSSINVCHNALDFVSSIFVKSWLREAEPKMGESLTVAALLGRARPARQLEADPRAVLKPFE